MASAMAAASGLSEEVLERLAADPLSCVERVARTAHVALSPASLGNLKVGVAQHFASHTNRYHPALHGILLGYRNPKLTASTGSLLYDQPHVHVDVTADFYMFTPTKGSVLCGVVNKKNFDRIVGCLVHQTFNVALMGGVQTLTRADNKEGSRVKIEVTRVNYGRDSLPFIQGKLLADEEGEMVEYDSGVEVKSEAGTPVPPVTEKRKREEDDIRMESGDQKLKETTKKSKKQKLTDVKEEIISEPKIKQEPEVTEPVPKKKKKKDKEKEKIKDVPEVEVKSEVESSDLKKEKKKKKKDKRRENEEAMPSQVEIKQEPEAQDEVLPVEKKRKKKNL